MDLERYRASAQHYFSESNFEKYRYRAGLKSSLDLAPIYDRYEELFAPETIRDIFILHREAAPQEEARLRHLLHFAVDTALDHAAEDEDAQLARVKATVSVPIEGQDVSFHSAAVRLTNEPDRQVRREAFEERRRIIRQTDPLRLERIKKLHQAAFNLTGRTYVELSEFLLKVNFDLLRRQLENFLGASQTYYTSRLDRFSREHLGVPADEIEPWDTMYLFRGAAYDEHFPEGKMLSILKRTLIGMDIDLKKLQNLTMDGTDRPNKSPEPECIPVEVPEQVYLIFRPLRGLNDCLSLFHEVGHALHYGFTSREEEFEFKYLGDFAMTETYAFLFQYIPLNDDWCWDFLKIPFESDFVEYNQLRKLYLLRRYAAKFLFELELHSGASYDLAALDKRYADCLQGALGFPADPCNALIDVDDGFYGTHFLRAWIFEAELRQIITGRFGKRWYSRPATGEFLKGLWAYGHRYTVEELAQQIRLSELDLSPITRELR